MDKHAPNNTYKKIKVKTENTLQLNPEVFATDAEGLVNRFLDYFYLLSEKTFNITKEI